MDETKKKELLGEAGKIKATHDQAIPVEKLNLPLEKGAAVRSFCQGCGTVFGIDFDNALLFLSLLAEESENGPESFAGHYFHIGACGFCDSEKLSIELRPIPKEKN